MADNTDNPGGPPKKAAPPAGERRPGGAEPAEGNGAARPAAATTAVPASPVGPRRKQYLIATRRIMGVAPMSTDMVAGSLNRFDDVEVVKRVAPRSLGAFSLGGPAEGTGTPEIIVARMPEERGFDLMSTAGPGMVVEEDRLLNHHDVPARFDPAEAPFLPVGGSGTEVTLQVVGQGGKPLADAIIYVYGQGFPAQGKTGADGRATVTLFGSNPGAIDAIYVKPAANHWDRFLRQPDIGPGVNTIALRPLSESWPTFPEERLVSWGQRLMRLDLVADAQRGGGVRIGIIDSGCDTSHPQLAHIRHGLDFTGGDKDSGWKVDSYAHGSHCAGIIAAAGQGILGFAPQAEVHAFKVFPGGRFSDLIDALDECVARRVDVVNLSLGSDADSELVALKLAEVRQQGVACVVAAGNSGNQVQFPARVPGVLAVGAIGRLGEFPADSYHATTPLAGALGADGLFVAKFSCFGPELAVSAPGVAVVSTVPGGYAALDGTSMAAPHVTGLAALVLAHHPAFQGELKARNARRVDGLFQLLGGSAVPYVQGVPARTGAGLPDLSRIPDQVPAPLPLGGVVGGLVAGQAFGQPVGGAAGWAQPPTARAAAAFQSLAGQPVAGAGQALAPAGFSPLMANPFAFGRSPVGAGPVLANPHLLQQLRAAGWL